MASWRFLRRWSEPELAAALARARELAPNFDVEAVRSPDRGWNLAASRALIAVETPGPPPPGGTFDRLWVAVEDFEHSDPRIVVAHFRRQEPPGGRVQILELRALGLGFLCPSRIAFAGAEKEPAQSRRWLALDTLEGHIERGREYFFLEKDHRSGEIRFHIEAFWQDGDFPNHWSRLGFHLVGRRYQRAWHRLAHFRLRRIAAGIQQRRRRAGMDGIAHRGVFLPAEPVQLYAQRGIGRRHANVEEEGEEMRSHEFWRAAGLGALSGVRSLTGPSSVLRSFKGRNAPKSVSALVSALALGELAADKLPFLPARTRLLPLLGRMASGAYVGAASRIRARARFPLAVIGAAAALASTYGSYGLRRFAIRRSPLLGWLVAGAEDALAVLASRRLVRSRFLPSFESKRAAT